MAAEQKAQQRNKRDRIREARERSNPLAVVRMGERLRQAVEQALHQVREARRVAGEVLYTSRHAHAGSGAGGSAGTGGSIGAGSRRGRRGSGRGRGHGGDDAGGEGGPLERQLLALGFAREHVRAVAAHAAALDDALDWLCLNLPEEQLPKCVRASAPPRAATCFPRADCSPPWRQGL